MRSFCCANPGDAYRGQVHTEPVKVTLPWHTHSRTITLGGISPDLINPTTDFQVNYRQISRYHCLRSLINTFTTSSARPSEGRPAHCPSLVCTRNGRQRLSSRVLRHSVTEQATKSSRPLSSRTATDINLHGAAWHSRQDAKDSLVDRCRGVSLISRSSPGESSRGRASALLPCTTCSPVL